MQVRIGDTIEYIGSHDISYCGIKRGDKFKITSIANEGRCLGFVHPYPGVVSVASGQLPNWNWYQNVHYKLIPRVVNLPKE